MEESNEIAPRNNSINNSEIVLYQPNDEIRLDVRLNKETVWLSQQQMALLFGVRENTITYHIKEIYKSQELSSMATTQKIRVVRLEGNRQIERSIDFYNLDMIISVGYRVNSMNATMFRRWATTVLKEYMLRGYAINQRLLTIEDKIDRRFAQYDRILAEHTDKIDFFVRTSLPPVEQVFFNGEFFTARVALENIIKTAKQRVILIDGYIDATTLDILDVRQEGVTAEIYTHNEGDKNQRLIALHNEQHADRSITLHKWQNPSHDRWLVVDEVLYHCGHSLKDTGRTLSAIAQLDLPPEQVLRQVKG